MKNIEPAMSNKLKLLLVFLPILLAISLAGCGEAPSTNNANISKPTPLPTPSPVIANVSTPTPTPAPGPPNCKVITPARTFQCPKDETINFIFTDSNGNTTHNFEIRLADNTTVEAKDVTPEQTLPVKLDQIKNVHLQHNLVGPGETTSVEIFDSQNRVFFKCLDPGVDFPRGCFFRKGPSDLPPSTTYTFKLKP